MTPIKQLIVLDFGSLLFCLVTVGQCLGQTFTLD